VNKEPIFVSNIIIRPSVKGNRRLPSRVRCLEKQKDNNKEKEECENNQVLSCELSISEHFTPSTFVAKPQEDIFRINIELKKSTECIITAGGNNEIAQSPGNGLLKITVMRDAVDIPLRSDAGEYILDTIHKTIFVSKALPYSFESSHGKRIIEAASKSEGDKVSHLFDFCKKLIDFGFYPITDDLIYSTPIYSTNRFVKGAKVPLVILTPSKTI
jgi:hypothetical protein